jgi:hypothetical protein
VSIDLASIRAGIATILAGIPEIQRVDQYAYPGESVQNTPFAQIFRGNIQGEGLSLGSYPPDAQLGGFDHLITWQIRVFQNLISMADAQQADDIIAQRLLDAFNGNLLIDPNGPGVVDQSRLVMITPFAQLEDRPTLWIAEATLMTFVIASL